MSNTKLTIGLVIAIVIAIVSVGTVLVSKSPSSDNYSAIGTRFPDGLAVGTTSPNRYKTLIGTNGTNIGTFIYGTCFLKFDGGITATSTTMVDCVSSSFQVGDFVDILGVATSSVAATRTIITNGTGSASSTAGFAPVRVTNFSGATLTPGGTGLGSSTPFILIRP